MNEEQLPIGFIPEMDIPKAYEDLFEPKRYKVYYGGRGGAKSHNFARALLAIGIERPIRVVCGREIQKSIADSVHQLLSDVIKLYKLEAFYVVHKETITGLNGTTFRFRGLKHNTTDLKSLEGCDILWVEEAENVSDNSWELLIPTIRKETALPDGTKKMSEIWVSFNPKNRTDPTYERFVANADEHTFTKKVSWRDNPFFPETLRIERDKLKKQDFEAYEHVWEGEFDQRRSGAVYAKQIADARKDGRVTSVPYFPQSEVFCSWDLGYGDATAIWWLQWVGRELRWIDYYENSGEQLDHYAQIVKQKNYNYAAMPVYLPHDGGHGNIRGHSVTKQLHSMGLKNIVMPRTVRVSDDIELLRATIAYSVFDKTKCKDGLHALEHYAYEYDDDRKVFKNKPKHDWASNGADAARYAAMAANNYQHGASNTYKKVDMSLASPSGDGGFMSL